MLVDGIHFALHKAISIVNLSPIFINFLALDIAKNDLCTLTLILMILLEIEGLQGQLWLFRKKIGLQV